MSWFPVGDSPETAALGERANATMTAKCCCRQGASSAAEFQGPYHVPTAEQGCNEPRIETVATPGGIHERYAEGSHFNRLRTILGVETPVTPRDHSDPCPRPP